MIDTVALREKVLDLAIRGKLVPQDPNDEPASVLLERIREQKQQMVKEGKLKAKDIKDDSVIFVGDDNLHYEKFADGAVKCIEDEIPFELPYGWAWCRLRDIFNVCSAKRVLQSEWKTEGVPFYRAREIVKLANNGYVDNELFISHEHYENLKETYGVPQTGDLMVTGVGTIGKVHIVREDDVFYYKDASVLCFENRYGVINSEYARIMIDSSLLQEQIHSQTYGNTVDTITISTANNYLCVLPPISEQSKIVQSVKTAVSLIDKIEGDNKEIRNTISLIKSKVLDLAIQGKLVPQDPNDEPASILLERIREEKEELIKQGKIKRDKKESIIFKGEDNSYYEKFADGTVKCIEDEIPFELPQGWLWCRLKDLFNVCSAKRVLQSEWKSEGIPFYRAREIVKLSNDGFVDNNLFISPEHYDRLRKTYGVPQAGDLMVTGVGTIGRVYIVHDDVFYYKDASVLCFENRYGAIDSEFAQIMLGSSFLQEQIHSKTYGNTVDTITISTANNYLCVLPPLSEQTRIIKEINEILALALHIEKSLN